MRFLPKIFKKIIFMVAKSFPLKLVVTKDFGHNFFGRKFFYRCKIISSKTGPYKKTASQFFWSENFKGCKIISSKAGSYQNISVKRILVENFLWLQNHYLENRFIPKIFLVENFLWLQNHFLENWLFPRILLRIFWDENFFIIAISFPQRQVPTKKVSSHIFCSKIFFGCKIIFSKTGSYPRF